MLSIVIPALNEAGTLAATLERIRAGAAEANVAVEVVVVDGGSRDATVEIARAGGARVANGARANRAEQMNAGAAIARGEVVLFLHADTLLPLGYLAQVRTLLARPGAIAGAFPLAISGSDPALRLVEWGVRLRSRWGQLPYGDQGLFLRADTFRDLGGFPVLPLLEDVEFVRKVRDRGRIELAPEAVVTSGRRWQQLGVWETTLLNQFILLGYRAGVAPTRLAQWYCGTRQTVQRARRYSNSRP